MDVIALFLELETREIEHIREKFKDGITERFEEFDYISNRWTVYGTKTWVRCPEHKAELEARAARVNQRIVAEKANSNDIKELLKVYKYLGRLYPELLQYRIYV